MSRLVFEGAAFVTTRRPRHEYGLGNMAAPTWEDESMTHYDLVIVGSGSGNSLVTPFWDNKKVAIIDGGVFGGTCLNKGCIPTKMFVVPATLASETEHLRKLGVDMHVDAVHWAKIRDRIFGRIDPISEAGRKYRAEELDNVELYEENARLVGPRELVTDSGKKITADQVVLANGSRPWLPPERGMDLPGVHTSETIMRIERLPRTMVVVGGGVIAAEFAAIFHGLGVEVTQVVRGEQLLKTLDDEIADAFTQAALRRWDIHRGWDIKRIGVGGDAELAAEFTRGDEKLTLNADVVLMATGRVPNSDTIDAKAAGFDVDSSGFVETDEYLRVLSGGKPVEGVWALGDITNPAMLKHVANREARVVSHNMENPAQLRAVDHSVIASAVFSNPQVASAGLTEAQAIRAAEDEGRDANDVIAYTQRYADVAYGWALEDDEGLVKLIAEKSTGKILGAFIMGEQAPTLIQPLIQAMTLGTDAYTMARAPYWIHPALTEVVENALLGLGTQPPENPAL